LAQTIAFVYPFLFFYLKCSISGIHHFK
ncbi:hypothetical protein A5797_000903, partial [Enterococcus faecalis]